MKKIGQLVNLFFMTHRSLHRHMQDARVMSSFSFPQFLAMKFIIEGGPVRMKDIAELLSISPASATSLVDGMARSGMLDRVSDRDDRRIVLLEATARGKRMLQEAEELARQELSGIFSRLSGSDQDHLVAVLQKLSRILAGSRSASSARRGPGRPRPSAESGTRGSERVRREPGRRGG